MGRRHELSRAGNDRDRRVWFEGGMHCPEDSAFAAAPDTEPATRPGTVTLECRALRMTYAHLRIHDPCAEARMSASIAEVGQRSPVIVVHDPEGQAVLIDGYRRVRVLLRLGHDTVIAVVLGLSEADALVYCHRQETSRRRSVVEEGWLVRELHGQGPTQEAIGLSLGKTPSWVSRRMALVSALPESVEEAVRRGRVPAHGAMKSLVPLARANRAQCEQLVQGLGNGSVTTRQMAHLYAAWRAGDSEQRARIVSAPRLFLRAAAASAPEPGEEIEWLVQKLGVAGEALRRAGESLAHRHRKGGRPSPPGSAPSSGRSATASAPPISRRQPLRKHTSTFALLLRVPTSVTTTMGTYVASSSYRKVCWSHAGSRAGARGNGDERT